LGGKGFLPTLAVGAGLAATVDFAAHGAATLAVGFYPERNTSAVGGRFAFGLSYVELSGCFVARPGPVRWELCAGGSAGALTVVVYDPQPVSPGQRWYLGVAQLTRVVVPIFPALLVEVGLEASEPIPRRSFFVEGGPPGMDTVFTQPYVALAAWTGLGLRWR
jgi:hypothetical protein